MKRSSVRALSHSLARALSTTAPTPSSFPLKTVNKSNFVPALESLRDHVRAADFIAIDLEMTGVASAPWRESFEFDSYDVRYLKVRDSAEKFAVVQFGVCPFRWDSEKLCFVAHPHNFYVFPRQELSAHNPSGEFLCQTASIDFLAKYQFDFNECIREGISYLSREKENELLGLLNESLSVQNNSEDFGDRPLFQMADVFFTERMKNRLKEWRDALLQEANRNIQPHGSPNDSVQNFQTIFYKLRPALSLNGFTAHQRRLIQLVASKHFEDLLYINVSEGSSTQHLVVYVASEADKELLQKEAENENRKDAESKINAAVGFRHVIDLLSSEKKLIVGHNCFLDIAHIYSKFFGPLPMVAKQFVSSFNKCFPHVIDTKVVLNSESALRNIMKKSSTSLSSAFGILCPQISLGCRASALDFLSSVNVEVQVDDIRVSTWNSGGKHEAGYDAFMTGCIFAQSCRHLGIDFRKGSLPPSEVLAQNELLQKHVNRLYLSWTYEVIIDLSTGDRIEASERSSSNSKKQCRTVVFENILLLWGLPPKIKATEIKDCIHKVFGFGSVVSVYHLDETAVLVQFIKAELVSKFLALKDTLERNNDPISVLSPLWKLFEGGSTKGSNYEVYKEICSSPMSKVLFADQAEAMNIKGTRRLESELAGGNLRPESARSYDNKTKIRSVETLADYPSCSSSSGDEIPDSCHIAEVEEIRTGSL